MAHASDWVCIEATTTEHEIRIIKTGLGSSAQCARRQDVVLWAVSPTRRLNGFRWKEPPHDAIKAKHMFQPFTFITMDFC